MFGKELPKKAGEDSFSFIDVLTAENVKEQRQNAVLLSNKGLSFVEKDWKLIDFNYSKINPQQKVELYNLSEAPSESIDLSSSNTENLKSMRIN
ncbi:MAG: hypothetical protein ACJA01_004040 [Saprospiraceae bacterium]